jgi:hypothetical protein
MKFVLGYLGIGLVLLIGTLFVNKKFKLSIFWEYDPWGGWSRNRIEFLILLGWPVAMAVSSITGLLYLIHRGCTLFIGGKPLEDKPEKEPENKLVGTPVIPGALFMTVDEVRKKYNLPPIQQGYEGKEKDLYLHLLETGCEKPEAAAIAKEIEEIGLDFAIPGEINAKRV